MARLEAHANALHRAITRCSSPRTHGVPVQFSIGGAADTACLDFARCVGSGAEHARERGGGPGGSSTRWDASCGRMRTFLRDSVHQRMGVASDETSFYHVLLTGFLLLLSLPILCDSSSSPLR
ncbi:hypothetical protein GY45DRAFT_1376489 [Cubamyces sp. BRFM 1775]|nr:hypothetical protein GY45DRAFT_1376489 [Cubamyces sp. BRFM 1775]